MNSGSKRAIFAAMAANFGIASTKFVGFAMTGSVSMLAESVHSFADTGNQVLLLWGAAAAARAPDSRHSFGYARERYFWSFVVALILFSLGGLFAIAQGLDRWQHPEPMSRPEIAISILIAGFVLEGFSLRTAIRESRDLKRDLGWIEFIRGTKNPELPVILLEDLGAICGLSIALAGVVLSIATGNPRFDGGASIAIGFLLCLLAALLAAEMKSLLIGESVSPEHLDILRAAIESSADVERVIHIRTQHLGPDDILVAAKVEFSKNIGFQELPRTINAAEARIRDRMPQSEIMIYLEPDIFVSDPKVASDPRC